MVIDHEYAGWNPMAYDLSNYFNETMLDNDCPPPHRIQLHEENIMTEQEVNALTGKYLEVYFLNYAKANIKSYY